MINNRQYILCSFFLTRFLFFGGSISYMLKISGSETWLYAIIGFLLGLLSFKILHILNNKYKNNNIINVIKDNIIMKIILFIFSIILLNYILTNITILNHSFFLYKTPPFIIAIMLMIVLIYGVNKEEKVFARVSEILFGISIFIFINKTILYGSFAINYYDNLFPIFNINFINGLKTIFIFYIYSFVPNILLLSFNNIDISYKKMIMGYVMGSISIILVIIIISLIFGFPLATIIKYPEYIVLKKISIFEKFKNIENILAITWEFDSIVSGFIILNIIKKINNNTISKKYQKYSYLLVIIFSLYLAINTFDNNYPNIIYLYHYGYIIITILAVIICSYYLIKKDSF